MYVKLYCLNIVINLESFIKILGMVFIIDISVLFENLLFIKFIQSLIQVLSDVIYIFNSEVIKDFIYIFLWGFQCKEWFCVGNN